MDSITTQEKLDYRYEERFTAFIDILGFKDAILESKVDALIKIIQLLRSEAENKPYIIERENYMVFMAGPGENSASDKFHSSREISVFSDLIVISYAVCNDISILNNLHKLLHSIYFIQEHLANNSILIRGGITCGELYHKGDICIGPALLRAYELEKSHALFPRVIIDPKIIEQNRFKGIVGRSPDYLEQYQDSLHFITHFKPLKTFFEIFPENHREEQIRTRRYQVIGILYSYKIAIEKALKSESEGTKEKGNWLKVQYLETMKYFESFYDFNSKERQFIDIAL